MCVCMQAQIKISKKFLIGPFVLKFVDNLTIFATYKLCTWIFVTLYIYIYMVQNVYFVTKYARKFK